MITAARQRYHDTSNDPPAPSPPSFSSPWSLTLFSSNEQRQRYYSLFSSRVILDPKYLDVELNRPILSGTVCIRHYGPMHLFLILILSLYFFSILIFLQRMNLLLRSNDHLLLVLVLLPPLDTKRIWMANGCVNKTFHLQFLMNAHPPHHSMRFLLFLIE